MVKRSFALFVVAIGAVACSGGGDETSVPVETDGSTTTLASGASGASGASDASADATTDDRDSVADPAPTEPGDTAAQQPETTPPIVQVPETGVPGLDSGDAFCAAWSRFGGSWQVLAVGSSFLEDAAVVVEWEVAAAPVIATAYQQLVENFPAELAAEADVVAEGYFGVLARRSAAAGDALAATGASVNLVQEIGEAWVAALAARDPFSPELDFELSDEAAGIVAAAGEAFGSQRVEFHLDPSMVVAAETPLTDAYLEVACPDQGTLGGQEVGGG